MDHTGGAGSLVPCLDGPGAAFIGPGCKEGPEAKKFVGALNKAHHTGFLKPKLLQEHLAVFVLLNLGNLGLCLGGNHKDLRVLRSHCSTHGVYVSVSGHGRCLIYVADVHHGLIGDEEEVMGHLLLFSVFKRDSTAGKALKKCLTVPQKQAKELFSLFVTSRCCHLLNLLDAVFHRLKVLDLELCIHHFLVTDGIYGTVHMGYVSVVKAAEDMKDGISLTDICKELVTKSFSL